MARRHSNIPTLLFGGFTVVTAVATGWFAVETYLLAKRRQPITWYMRNALSWHPGVASFLSFLFGAGAAAAVVHFVADEQQPG